YSPSVVSPSVFSPSVFSPSVFSPSVFSPSVFSPSVFSPSVFSPSVFSPSVFSPSVFSPSVFSPSVFSPDAFASAQTRSLLAVDADAGTSDKTVVANTWNSSGTYYVRVTGRNGAFSTDGAYSVSVARTGTSCASVANIGAAPATAPGTGVKTVILTDPSRIAGSATDKATLAAKLAAFAARPEVSGSIVDLSQSPRIAQLNAQADANTACPYAKNLVASAIKDVVDSYRPNNPLQYVVIVGGDGVVPFFRYPDESLLGEESGYLPPVQSTSASDTSLRLNYVLGQDAYGAKTSISLGSSDFPVPDLAVGRLVETASEASGMLDAYTAAGGVVVPHSTLVTGYDFLADDANSVEGDLAAGTAGAGQVADTLIAPNNISPQDPRAWTAAQLKTKLLGPVKHDIVFLAGHFSANSALAADFSTSLLTTDLAASSTSFQNTIVFSAGCHSGYNIVDGDAVPGVTLPLDWAQTFAQKHATLIGGTGYQYGDTDFIQYSEAIYANFAKQLRYGTGGVPIGSALVAAKQTYLSATPDIHGLPEKALLESTLFGLPMLSVNMPANRLSPPSSGSTVGSVSSYPADPGLTLGLRTTTVTVTPTLTQHTVALQNVSGGSPLTATYYSGGAGVQSKPAEPAVPLEQLDVTAPDPSLVLRGVGFRGGAYTDQTVVPLTGAPTTELRGVHVPFVSPVFYPMRLATPDYFGALHGGQTNLVVTPAQHEAADVNAGTSTLRLYSNMSLQLFYSGYLGSAALSDAPAISGVQATTDAAGNVTFSAHAVGNPAAGMQQLWVTYTGDGPSRWTSLDLTQDPTDSTLWTGTLNGISSPANLRFMVQAANGLGLVSLDDNLGAYYQVAGATSGALAPTTLQLQSPPTSGTFGGNASVTALLQSGGTGLAGKNVQLSIGGSSRLATTGADGSVTVSIPLSSLPGPTTVTAAFGGDGGYRPAGASAPFTIGKAATSLSALSPGLLFGGGSSGPTTLTTTLTSNLQGATQPLLQRSVTFSVTGPTSRTYPAITDFLGKAALPTSTFTAGTYSVTATFVGDATYVGSSRTGPFTISKLTATTTCNGVYVGTGQNVTVPRGAVCVLLPGTKVTNDVVVQAGGELVANGITVGHDVSITKASGPVSICASTISHDLTVNGSTGPVVIGSTNGGCSAGDTISHDVNVQNVVGAVDISNNAIGHDLVVQYVTGSVNAASDSVSHDIVVQYVTGSVNAASDSATHDVTIAHNAPGPVVVTGNHAGHDAVCQANQGQSGGGNTAPYQNSCPA
ncbi:MAG: large repetitive protein, partial [Actinomycetota bacterium]|nr:large repetitive protein [Actinomycetota bacterium]